MARQIARLVDDQNFLVFVEDSAMPVDFGFGQEWGMKEKGVAAAFKLLLG